MWSLLTLILNPARHLQMNHLGINQACNLQFYSAHDRPACGFFCLDGCDLTASVTFLHKLCSILFLTLPENLLPIEHHVVRFFPRTRISNLDSLSDLLVTSFVPFCLWPCQSIYWPWRIMSSNSCQKQEFQNLTASVIFCHKLCSILFVTLPENLLTLENHVVQFFPRTRISKLDSLTDLLPQALFHFVCDLARVFTDPRESCRPTLAKNKNFKTWQP